MKSGRFEFATGREFEFDVTPGSNQSRMLGQVLFRAIRLSVNFSSSLIFCENLRNRYAKTPVPKFILNGPPGFN